MGNFLSMTMPMSGRVIAVVALPAASALAAEGDVARDYVFSDPRR